MGHLSISKDLLFNKIMNVEVPYIFDILRESEMTRENSFGHKIYFIFKYIYFFRFNIF